MRAIVVKDRALVTDGIDVIRAAAPNTPELHAGSRRHRAPSRAVVVDDRTTIPDGKDILFLAPPHAQQELTHTGGHRLPVPYSAGVASDLPARSRTAREPEVIAKVHTRGGDRQLRFAHLVCSELPVPAVQPAVPAAEPAV